jgi:hypothetical protein
MAGDYALLTDMKSDTAPLQQKGGVAHRKRVFIPAVILGLFVLLYEPLRAYIYWSAGFSWFATSIGGTGGVGGLLGMTICDESLYCFWYDLPVLGLTWHAAFVVLVWWGTWLFATALHWLRPSVSRQPYSVPSGKRWAQMGAAAAVFWVLVFLVYYFSLTRFYRDDIVLGISLAGACGVMMTLTALSLSIGHFSLPARVLRLTSLSVGEWPSSAVLHKIIGSLVLICVALHGGGEVVFMLRSADFVQSITPAIGRDPILATGFATFIITGVHGVLLCIYAPSASLKWQRALRVMLCACVCLALALVVTAFGQKESEAADRPPVARAAKGLLLFTATVLALALGAIVMVRKARSKSQVRFWSPAPFRRICAPPHVFLSACLCMCVAFLCVWR